MLMSFEKGRGKERMPDGQKEGRMMLQQPWEICMHGARRGSRVEEEGYGQINDDC